MDLMWIFIAVFCFFTAGFISGLLFREWLARRGYDRYLVEKEPTE